MRARARRSAAWLPVAAWLALAGCGGGTRACKQGTLFVTVDFGSAKGATQVTIDVSIAGQMTASATRDHMTGVPVGTIEIDFPTKYPAGERVDVTITALANGRAIKSNTATVDPFPAGCGTLAIALDGGGPGTGGGGGMGGTGGGAAGRGGTVGTGGSVAGRGGSAGGAGGTAGRGGSGGVGNTGGSAGRGGTGGSAGTTGSAGTGGTGGTSGAPACRFASFDSGTEGFVLNPYDTTAGNLLFPEGGSPATVAWSTEGAPAAGSLKIDAPFSDYKQYANVIRTLPARQNWAGVTKLHARVRIASGLDQSSANPPAIQLYANSYNVGHTGVLGYYYRGGYVRASSGAPWLDYVVDLSPDQDFDPTSIDNIGVNINAGDGLGGGTVSPRKPTPAIVYVDSFWLEGSCAGPAGTFPAATTCGAGWTVGNDGFVSAPGASGACWHGYAFTDGDNGSNVLPRNFWTCGAACVLGITGTLGPATMANSYSGQANVGFRLAQDAGSAAARSVVPAGSSVTVTFSNSSAASLGPPRVELSDENGGFWCYMTTGASPVTIPYAMFNTTCWDAANGTAYMKQAINTLAVTIPGADGTASLNLTLTGVKEN